MPVLCATIKYVLFSILIIVDCVFAIVNYIMLAIGNVNANATYYEISMSLDIIGYISLNQEVMNSMGSYCSVEGVVDRAVSYVRAIHTSTEMEMN